MTLYGPVACLYHAMAVKRGHQNPMIPIPKHQYAILQAELAARIASGTVARDWNDIDPPTIAARACIVAVHILHTCGLESAPEYHSASDGVRSMMFKTIKPTPHDNTLSS